MLNIKAELLRNDKGKRLKKVSDHIFQKLACQLAPIQGDQIDLAVFFWYPVKSDAIVYASVQQHNQITFHKIAETHGHL